MPLDLLAPQGAESQLRANYVHQLQQTIDAYLPSFIFVGEALQNALDAVREAAADRGGDHTIDVKLDFTQRAVTVTDTGNGFPDAPNLLFLGGGRKAGMKLAGMVGVGLKVVLFSSDSFSLRSRRADGTTRVQITGASDFAAANCPSIELPDPQHLPSDSEPLPAVGTVIPTASPPRPRARSRFRSGICAMRSTTARARPSRISGSASPMQWREVDSRTGSRPLSPATCAATATSARRVPRTSSTESP